MRYIAAFACALLAGCGNSPQRGGATADLGTWSSRSNFDPCASAGGAGVDPVAAGLPACCGGGSGGASAHCLPSSAIPESSAAAFAGCPEGGLCVPDPVIRAGAAYTPKPCTSSFVHSPGACLSRCLQLTSAQLDLRLYAQDDCDSGDLCVPCIDPLARKQTGACTFMSHSCGAPADMAVAPTDGGSDGGTTPAGSNGTSNLSCPYDGPPLFDANLLPPCSPACAGAHCAPKELVPPAQQSQLASCTFGSSAGLCVPDAMSTSVNNYVPPTCRSVAGAEGRCLSTCVANVAAQAALLPQAGCPPDTRCAPCFDPTAADPTAPTGACSLACDAPKEPPLILTCPWTGPAVLEPDKLPACSPACGGAHCVPAAHVPPAQRPLLASCPGGYCTPDPNIRAGGAYVPPTCEAFEGTPAEGRCQSACLPPIAAQAAQLHRHSCTDGELCAPCYDPFTGAATGSCTTACDRPAQPAYTFPPCCHGNEGTCVPTENIPPSQQSHLQQLDCPQQLECVPKEMLPGGAPQTCTALWFPGVCLSDCLAGVPPLPQSTCPAHHACIPCALAPSGTPGC